MQSRPANQQDEADAIDASRRAWRMTKLVGHASLPQVVLLTSRVPPTNAHRTLSDAVRIEDTLDANSSPTLLLSFPHPPSPAPGTPPAPTNLHHGLAQHLQQRPQHHTELPERRQHPAAAGRPGSLAHIRTMGSLRRGRPAGQRFPGRQRQGERAQGPEHRRYVHGPLSTRSQFQQQLGSLRFARLLWAGTRSTFRPGELGELARALRIRRRLTRHRGRAARPGRRVLRRPHPICICQGQGPEHVTPEERANSMGKLCRGTMGRMVLTTCAVR
jgi:hypothetical protein